MLRGKPVDPAKLSVLWRTNTMYFARFKNKCTRRVSASRAEHLVDNGQQLLQSKPPRQGKCRRGNDEGVGPREHLQRAIGAVRTSVQAKRATRVAKAKASVSERRAQKQRQRSDARNRAIAAVRRKGVDVQGVQRATAKRQASEELARVHRSKQLAKRFQRGLARKAAGTAALRENKTGKLLAKVEGFEFGDSDNFFASKDSSIKSPSRLISTSNDSASGSFVYLVDLMNDSRSRENNVTVAVKTTVLTDRSNPTIENERKFYDVLNALVNRQMTPFAFTSLCERTKRLCETRPMTGRVPPVLAPQIYQAAFRPNDTVPIDIQKTLGPRLSFAEYIKRYIVARNNNSVIVSWRKLEAFLARARYSFLVLESRSKLASELRGPSQPPAIKSLHDVLNDRDIQASERMPMLMQFAYTFHAMFLVGLSQNDMHPGNVLMVRNPALATRKAVRKYVYLRRKRDGTVLEHEFYLPVTRWEPRVFDMDRAIKVAAAPNAWRKPVPVFQRPMIDEYRALVKRFDYYGGLDKLAAINDWTKFLGKLAMTREGKNFLAQPPGLGAQQRALHNETLRLQREDFDRLERKQRGSGESRWDVSTQSPMTYQAQAQFFYGIAPSQNFFQDKPLLYPGRFLEDVLKRNPQYTKKPVGKTVIETYSLDNIG